MVTDRHILFSIILIILASINLLNTLKTIHLVGIKLIDILPPIVNNEGNNN